MQTELSLQDLAINLDEVTELQDSSVFSLKRGDVSHTNKKSVLFAIQLEIDYDKILIERNGYTIMDFLADIGGLHGTFVIAISLILSILNLNQLENFLISRLYHSSEQTSQQEVHLKLKTSCFLAPFRCLRDRKQE